MSKRTLQLTTITWKQQGCSSLIILENWKHTSTRIVYMILLGILILCTFKEYYSSMKTILVDCPSWSICFVDVEKTLLYACSFDWNISLSKWYTLTRVFLGSGLHEFYFRLGRLWFNPGMRDSRDSLGEPCPEQILGSLPNVQIYSYMTHNITSGIFTAYSAIMTYGRDTCWPTKSNGR